MKFFRSSSATSTQSTPPSSTRLSRRSNGLAEVMKLLGSEESLWVLDLGATSPTNIRYFTEKGHKIYSEDLIEASSDPSLAITDEQGKPALDSRRFLAENLTHPAARFDIILCWNLADYMDESLVKPVVGKLWSVLKPGGLLLAFFHMKESGPDAIYYRYHIVGNDVLEMQPVERRGNSKNGTAPLRLQRVFNNRNIENLFRDFASIKFFLGRDNIREVLVVR